MLYLVFGQAQKSSEESSALTKALGALRHKLSGENLFKESEESLKFLYCHNEILLTFKETIDTLYEYNCLTQILLQSLDKCFNSIHQKQQNVCKTCFSEDNLSVKYFHNNPFKLILEFVKNCHEDKHDFILNSHILSNLIEKEFFERFFYVCMVMQLPDVVHLFQNGISDQVFLNLLNNHCSTTTFKVLYSCGNYFFSKKNRDCFKHSDGEKTRIFEKILQHPYPNQILQVMETLDVFHYFDSSLVEESKAVQQLIEPTWKIVELNQIIIFLKGCVFLPCKKDIVLKKEYKELKTDYVVLFKTLLNCQFSHQQQMQYLKNFMSYLPGFQSHICQPDLEKIYAVQDLFTYKAYFLEPQILRYFFKNDDSSNSPCLHLHSEMFYKELIQQFKDKQCENQTKNNPIKLNLSISHRDQKNFLYNINKALTLTQITSPAVNLLDSPTSSTEEKSIVSPHFLLN